MRSRDPMRSVRAALERNPTARRYVLAVSGGIDSMVLLHALEGLRAQYDLRLIAVHVNHGLHSQANAIEAFCGAFCRELGVRLLVETIEASPPRGQSIEAWARRRRYEKLQLVLEDGDCLVTAHHQDDQAETFILQALRGAGPNGLAAMQNYGSFGSSALMRPLLECRRSDILAYAEQHGVPWMDDPTNEDLNLERNFIRMEILPRLERRHAGCRAALAEASRRQAASAALLDMLAEQDLQRVAVDDATCLAAGRLLEMDRARGENLFRYWIRRSGFPSPGYRQVDEVFRSLLPARPDACPCVKWEHGEVRRYRDRVFVMAPLGRPPTGFEMQWDFPSSVRLAGGRLLVAEQAGGGLDHQRCLDSRLVIRFRRGGERGRPAGRRHSLTLKKLFQEAGVPPWLRERIPLLFIDGSLAAVPGYWIFEPFAASNADRAWLPVWRPDVRGPQR